MISKPRDRIYFQDYMPGNVCFGCGNHNHHGLQIKSWWEEDVALCRWTPQEKYHGWPNLLNGGILATLIDCHCMGTAMAFAYKHENRGLDSLPEYRYATGTLHIKYLKPTPNDQVLELRARVSAVKDRKTTLLCDCIVNGSKTAEAEVVAIRVYDSSRSPSQNAFM